LSDPVAAAARCSQTLAVSLSRGAVGLWSAAVTVAATSSLAYSTSQTANKPGYGFTVEEGSDWFRCLAVIFGVSPVAGVTLLFRRQTRAVGVGLLIGGALSLIGTGAALIVYVLSNGS
jgi:hypothetical protein